MAQNDDRLKLIEAACRHTAAGDSKFSIGALCAEAGVDRDVFRACFTGKSELLAAAAEAAKAPEAPRLAAEPVAAAAAPDAWLERRLRVFERALTALEARAEADAQRFQQAIAQLEEKLNATTAAAPPVSEIRNRPVALQAASAKPEPEILAADVAPAEPESLVSAAEEAEVSESPDALRARQEALVLPLDIPPQESAPSKAEMAELLEGARRATRAAEVQAERHPGKDATGRLRWFALGGMSLVAMFVCAGVTLSNAARASLDAMDSGSGISRRHVAADSFSRTVARADYGDSAAQAELALTYLRGDHGVADSHAAAHWAEHAAEGGQAVAQYMMGTLYHGGVAVAPNPKLAFDFFMESAGQGNVKAMHNLAIAYAEGLGTAKDPQKAADWFARAAARGYVDSAFDLAVLYERGDGVEQNLREALKWYQVAAQEGDMPSQGRVEVLSRQLPARDAAVALAEARIFMPMRADIAANILPAF